MLYTPAFAALFIANLFLVASFATFFLFPLFITGHGGSHQDIGWAYLPWLQLSVVPGFPK